MKRDEIKFWEFDEYMKFSKAMEEDSLFHCVFELLFWTGMRESELFALSRGDFDFEKKTVSVTKPYRAAKGEKATSHTDSLHGGRIVYLPDKVCEEVQDYFAGSDDAGASRAFPVTKNSLDRAMEKGIEKADVKKIRVQDLRHSHIALLITFGFGASEIGERVGTRGVTIRLRYAGLFPDKQKKMMDRLNGLIRIMGECDCEKL